VENIPNNEIPKELVTIYLFPRKASKDYFWIKNWVKNIFIIEGLFVGGSLTSTFVPAALEVAGLLPVYGLWERSEINIKNI